ncbi:MAG: hypothetical protein IPQ07_34420 [Myxococcales bacterium]|nr:hypothetical protein [Myxococcales bacterium]
MLPSDSHYELPECHQRTEDIHAQIDRIRDVCGAGCDPDPAGSTIGEPRAVHRQLDLAYTNLMDAAKRKEYDLELFPDGVPVPVTPPSPEPRRVGPRAPTKVGGPTAIT